MVLPLAINLVGEHEQPWTNVSAAWHMASGERGGPAPPLPVCFTLAARLHALFAPPTTLSLPCSFPTHFFHPCGSAAARPAHCIPSASPNTCPFPCHLLHPCSLAAAPSPRCCPPVLCVPWPSTPTALGTMVQRHSQRLCQVSGLLMSVEKVWKCGVCGGLRLGLGMTGRGDAGAGAEHAMGGWGVRERRLRGVAAVAPLPVPFMFTPYLSPFTPSLPQATTCCRRWNSIRFCCTGTFSLKCAGLTPLPVFPPSPQATTFCRRFTWVRMASATVALVPWPRPSSSTPPSQSWTCQAMPLTLRARVSDEGLKEQLVLRGRVLEGARGARTKGVQAACVYRLQF